MAYPRRFGAFARALNELARVPATVARKSAADIQTLWRRSIRAGVTPYGAAWAPLTAASLRRGRRSPPLRKYRPLVSVRPTAGAGLALTVDHPQAGFHQTGTRHMARRELLPSGTLPASWRAALKRRFQQELRAR